jgi:pyruvate/2-oxoglutarate/acetoin dehydrogenase E1 component
MTATETPVAPTARSSRRLTTAKAMVEGIELEMERDPSVFYLGEDVGAYGGIFSSTTGLLDRFGPARVLDTPISESAFIGLAIGAAVEGMRPIAELMLSDFMGVCLDQVYNHMAKIHFESGNVRVPMVLTTAIGGGYSDGAQHSQCLWGTFAHVPGMRVVLPSTIVTLSLSVHRALDAADSLAAQGIDAEVIDLRSLVPLDRDTILESVTGSPRRRRRAARSCGHPGHGHRPHRLTGRPGHPPAGSSRSLRWCPRGAAARRRWSGRAPMRAAGRRGAG